MFGTLFKCILVCFFFVTMLAYPTAAAEAAAQGLSILWNNVIPALLPFFLCSELFLGLRVVNCLAIWLEPLMRPLFRLPGAATLPLIMGFSAGSPTSAVIIARLREQGLCSRNEGERLLAFTSNPGPLYILAAVAAILQSPAAGLRLLVVLYAVNLAFGWLLRFFAPSCSRAGRQQNGGGFRAGLAALQSADCLSFAQLLTIAIKKATATMAVVSGYILFFSVLCRLLTETGLIKIIGLVVQPLCQLLGLDLALVPALCAGSLEMTVGIAALQSSPAPLNQQIYAAALLLAWNGISIQAQISGMLYRTDLRLHLYYLARVSQGFVACAILHFLPAPTPAFAAASTPLVLNLPPYSGILLLAIGIALTVLAAVVTQLWLYCRRQT